MKPFRPVRTINLAFPISRFASCFFLVAVAFLFLVPESFAQRDPERPDLADLLPETTVALIQFPDIKDAFEKIKNGNAGKMLEEESIAPLRDRIMEEANKAYSEVEEDVGLSLEDFASIPSGEMVFATIAPRRSSPVFMVILEVGEDNEAANNAFGIAMEKISDGEENTVEKAELESGIEIDTVTVDGYQVYIAKHDGLIVGCSNEKELNDFFTRWDGGDVAKVRPLSKNRKFITVMNRCRSQKDLPLDFTFFFDPIALIKSSNRGNISAQAVIAMFPSIGLDSILAIGGSMILDDDEYESILHGHLLLSNPRKGVTKVISLKPGEYEPEPWVPFDSFFYSTTSWDVPQMYAELREIFDLVLEEGTFDNFIENRVNENLQMSLEEDILPNFTGRVSTSQVSVDPGKLNTGSFIFAFELADVDAATETIEKITTQVNGESDNPLIEKREVEGFSYWLRSESSIESGRERRRKRREERNAGRDAEQQEQEEARQERRDIRRATFRAPRGVYGIIGDSLVVCDSIEAFERSVATFQGDVPSLQNEEGFVKMANQMTGLLGSDMPCAIYYNNPKHQLGPLLEFANSDSTANFLTNTAENSDVTKMIKGVLDDHKLPSMEVMEKYIAPQGGFATSDDTGYHFIWFQERINLDD